MHSSGYMFIDIFAKGILKLSLSFTIFEKFNDWLYN